MKYCVRSPIVPGVATARRDDSGAWRPPPEAHTVSEAAAASAPSFVGEMLNMTVPVGRDVDLDCQVKNAEGYKVSEQRRPRPIFVLLRDGFPPRWVHFGRLSFVE